MKKIIMIIMLSGFLTLGLAVEYVYNLFLNSSEIGNIKLSINDEERITSTIVEMSIQGSDMIFKTITNYNKEWILKDYQMNMIVDSLDRGTLKSEFDGKVIKNNFSGIKLKEYKSNEFVILDNNFILGHYYGIMKNNIEGNTNIFIPQLSLNPQTQNMALLEGNIFRQENVIEINYSGIKVIIKHSENIIESIEIPAQRFKAVKADSVSESKAKYHINYIESNFNSFDGLKISGELTIPENTKYNDTVFVIVHGSGPVDKNGFLPISETHTVDMYKDLSDELADKGLISYRYDKRNYIFLEKYGYPEYIYASKDILVEDFIEDAKYAAKHLSEKGFKNIFVVGHSQGGSLLPYIIEDDYFISGIILAPGLLRIDENLIYQIDYQIKMIESINLNNDYDMLLNQLNSYKIMIQEELDKYTKGVYKKYDFILGTYSYQFFDNWVKLTENVPSLIKNINKQTLLINGTSDLKTPVKILEEKKEYMLENKNLQIILIDGMVHELYDDNYMFIKEELVESIYNWIQEVIKND